MGLTDRQTNFYRHRMWVYRGAGVTKDTRGNPASGGIVKAVAGLQDISCKLHETPQFNTRRAPGVKVNQDTLMTADELRFERSLDVRGDDYVKVVSDLGTTLWYRVAGEAKTKGRRANSAHVFLQVTPPPTIEA